MSRVLVFAPKFDLATSYGNAWMNAIANMASGMGHQVLLLDTEEATQENLFSSLESFKPDLFFGCSHGDPSRFSGQNAQIVFAACQNDERMSGIQGFYLSCLMGQQLAPSMVSKSAVAVAAYTSEYVWLIDDEYASREDYLNDPYAFPFWRSIRESARVRLQGGSWRQFYDAHTRLCDQGIQEWFNSSDPNAGEVIAALRQNKDSLVVLGDVNIGGGAGLSGGLLVPALAVGFLGWYFFLR